MALEEGVRLDARSAGLNSRDFGPVEQRRARPGCRTSSRPGRRRRRPTNDDAAATIGSGGQPVAAGRRGQEAGDEQQRVARAGRSRCSSPDSAKTIARQDQQPALARPASRGSAGRAARSVENTMGGGYRRSRRVAGARPGPGPLGPRAPLGSPRLRSVRRSRWRPGSRAPCLRQARSLALREGDGADQHDQGDAGDGEAGGVVVAAALMMAGRISSETRFITLISGLSAGPAVSLNGSPTVSPMTAALWASEPLPPSWPSSMYFLALSHAPPALRQVVGHQLTGEDDGGQEARRGRGSRCRSR